MVSTDRNQDAEAVYVNKQRNVRVTNGKLMLSVYATNEGKYKYEGGRVTTLPNMGFKYGKLEIRAKGTAAAGAWMALWMKPTAGTKSRVKGEIDLMEYFGLWGRKKVQANFHLWGEFSGKANNHIDRSRQSETDIARWHIYTLEWYKDSILCKVDGKETYKLRKKDFPEWPFDMSYMLLLANTYGFKSSKSDDRQLPTRLQIDYVRYYKLRE